METILYYSETNVQMFNLVLNGNSARGNLHDLYKHTSQNIIIEGTPSPKSFKEEFEE